VLFKFDGVSALLNENWFKLDGLVGTLRIRLCKILSDERLIGIEKLILKVN
jgi:hypothetical protein